jgi:hypothetical protein
MSVRKRRKSGDEGAGEEGRGRCKVPIGGYRYRDAGGLLDGQHGDWSAQTPTTRKGEGRDVREYRNTPGWRGNAGSSGT